jgi:hypothetical protein
MECVVAHLSNLYRGLGDHGLCPSAIRYLHSKDIAEMTAAIQSRDGDIDLRQVARQSKSESDFIEAVLTGPRCVKNRLKDPFQNVEVADINEKSSPQQRWDGLLEAVKGGHSAAISVCLNHLAAKDSGIPPGLVRFSAVLSTVLGRIDKHPIDSAFGCAGHAVVVHGMRWSEKNHRCEIAIQNSWGADNSIFQGWLPAEAIMSATLDVTYLKEKK